MREEEDDFEGSEEPPFEGVYILDDDTHRLVEVVIGMIHMLASTQVDETARENCFIIADEMSSRFAVDADDVEVEEIIHGDEVLYKPRGGVMGDEPEDAEGPAPDEPQSGKP